MYAIQLNNILNENIIAKYLSYYIICILSKL